MLAEADTPVKPSLHPVDRKQAAVAIICLLAWLVRCGLSQPTFDSFRDTSQVHDWQHPDSLDVVVAYYGAPLGDFRHLRRQVELSPEVQRRKGHVRWLIYTKSSYRDPQRLLYRTGATVVQPLINQGRESDTYLQHIQQNYDSLAAHTIFVQDRMDWDGVIERRLMHLTNSTAYANLGPNVVLSCTKDHENNMDFPRLGESSQ